MEGFVMMDWNTIRGAANSTVVQSEGEWLDLSNHQDVLFWVDCREVSGATTPQIQFQTSPTKDDSLFQAMVAATNLTTSGVQVYKVILSQVTGAAIPLARHVRWVISCTNTAAWDATLRIMVAANGFGA
jgi:hypothetical protein